jgi:hypothetical protein
MKFQTHAQKPLKVMKKITSTSVFLLVFRLLFANSPFFIQEKLEWSSYAKTTSGTSTEKTTTLWTFKGAVHSDETPGLPWMVKELAIESSGSFDVQIIKVVWEDLPTPLTVSTSMVSENLQFRTSVEKDRNQFFGKIAFIPIIKQGDRYQRVASIELRVDLRPQPELPRVRTDEFASASALREGQIYKIAVQQNGIHRLSYDFIKNQLKIDIDKVDPRTLKIFGQGGGMLPAQVDRPRIDDLVENFIQVSGEDDGKFDPTDFILFYAQGPDKWELDDQQQFNLVKHIYDTQNYYFLVVSAGNGKRLGKQTSLNTTAFTTTTFNDFGRLEDDKVNLLAQAQNQINTTGSGQRWFGDWFKGSREYTYLKAFSFPNLVTDQPVQVKAEMALRAAVRSRFSVALNGAILNSNLTDYGIYNFTSNEDDYAVNAALASNASLNRDDVDLIVRYPNPDGVGDQSEGWLDYVQVNARRKLLISGDQMIFRDLNSLKYPSTTFQLGNMTDNIAVWDITDPQRPLLQDGTRNGSQYSFGVPSSSLKTFVTFNTQQNFPSPRAVGSVDRQNLHALTRLDLVIVYPAVSDATEQQGFVDAANRLAQHRNTYNGYRVATVRTDQIYNEFSSGRTDPTAIRNFARMLYTRDPNFRYLLLMGDGSYDVRNIDKKGDNLIPAYEADSFNPLDAFPSDDYYALLENIDPNPLQGRMNVAVGRLTARNASEAGQMTDKLLRYDSEPSAYSDWRNRLLFVGDDEDNDLHSRDVNFIADSIAYKFPNFNTDKILIDAFQQQSTAGGNFYPDVNASINRNIFKGILAVTYLGHGGPNGWAQERILTIPDIVNWQNSDRMPLFVTATCSFTNYDNPGSTSAGEAVLLNAKGGAIALFSTVRAVYASENFLLTERSLEILFQRAAGALTIGDAMRTAKNAFTGSGITTNSRKYGLFGDPSMQLSIPRYPIITTQINSKPIAGGKSDTLQSLQKVTIEGAVTGTDGRVLSNFNGIIYPTIFDKKVVARTLGQDPTSQPMDFTLQKNVIFKGRAKVEKGLFKFTFVVPKDINYAYGPGKISYYASDTINLRDAAGGYENVIIGGTSATALADKQGPVVDVFMNTSDFVFGGLTGPSPLLLVKLADNNGINVVGNSIGHDLEAVLDENTQNAIILNDFFETELNDYSKGSAKYPLSKLKDGLHKVRVKAWDVANNPSEGYTEFIVAQSASIALQHVLNYPNPFTDRTCFQFDHNLAGQQIDVLIQIFTISGRLVKTLEKSMISNGSIRQDDCIEWNGRDDFGDPLARGVYVYKVKVKANFPGGAAANGESAFEKLVLLK